MNTKITVRVIQQGQTQKSHTVNSGAGQNGQALVLQAAANTRYQLTDAVTFTSPGKLQIRREGKHLLLALPGNDVSTPDVVVLDYFEFAGMSLSGLSASGEPMVYDASGMLASLTPGNNAGVNAQTLASGQTTAVSLAQAGSWFDSGWGLAALAGGGALLAGGLGKSSSNSTDASALSKITTYKSDATKAVPSVTDFANAGVSGVDNLNITGVLSYFSRTQLPLNTAASIQTLVDSYKKILAKANGTASDTNTDEPTSTDYGNLMGANTPASIVNKANALALLNDRLKALNSSEVDIYSELKAYADAVDAVALLAQGSGSTTGTAASTGNLTQAQLISLGVAEADAKTANLSAYSDAIRAQADDMSSLGTTAKLNALISGYNTILAEANGSAADATVANPSAADYAAIGANIGSASTDSAALARLNALVGSLASTAVDTVDEINKLAATLDKVQTVAALAAGSPLTDAQKFSADELKNLGLSGFTSSEANNTALALKVSEAIRDADPSAVVAGTGTGYKLDNGDKKAADQTQIERLQALVSLEIIKNYSVNKTDSTLTTLAPTISDYSNVGLFSPRTDGSGKYDAVSSTQLAYLNSAVDALPATALNTAENRQTVLAAYDRIVQEANGSTDDTNTSRNPSAADLTAVGVTGAATAGQGANLLLDVIANLSSTSVDTVAKLRALADTAAKIMSNAAGAAETFTPDELSTLGLRGASASGASSNVAKFLEHIQNSADDGSEVNTVKALQARLSLAVLQVWARDVNPDNTASPPVAKAAATPSAQDYKDMEVVRSVAKNANDGSAGTVPSLMSSADASALNDAIDTLVDNKVSTTDDDAKISTQAKVQAIAASYFKILNEANGSASNYVTGNTVQTTDGGETPQGNNNGATTTEPNNVSVFRIDIDIGSVSAIDLNPNPAASDYQAIGLDRDPRNPPVTFTNDRLSLLNTVVGEKTFAQVDTVKELQTIADSVDKVLALVGKANGQASVADTDKLSLTQLGTDLGLTGVNTKNLDDVLLTLQNQDVANANTFDELQSWVSFTRIQRYADNSSTGTGATNEGGALPTFATGSGSDDWKNLIGVNDEISANYPAYNSAVEAFTKNYFTADTTGIAKLQSLVTSYNTILNAADGNADTVPGTPSAGWAVQFTNVGLQTTAWSSPITANTNYTNNTWNLLADAISRKSSSQVDTSAKLQSLANAAARVLDLVAQSDGVPTVTSGTDNRVFPTNLSVTDLDLLGLANTTKIVNGSGTYDSYEWNNIRAQIQNMDPTQAITLAALQQKINDWAL